MRTIAIALSYAPTTTATSRLTGTHKQIEMYRLTAIRSPGLVVLGPRVSVQDPGQGHGRATGVAALER